MAGPKRELNEMNLSESFGKCIKGSAASAAIELLILIFIQFTARAIQGKLFKRLHCTGYTHIHTNVYICVCVGVHGKNVV